MTRSIGPAGGAPERSGAAGGSSWQRRSAGAWYFVVTVLSAGFLAAIPFWHAARRLGRPAVRRLAVLYTVADVVLVVLVSLTPQDANGGTRDSAVGTVGGLLVIAIVVAGCIQLRGLRREVYGGAERTLAATDPVVARALAARSRRQDSRELLARDPALARDLGIGRPDLKRGYDDGGLVDVNGASAETIAAVCGMDLAQAQLIVTAREARSGGWFNIDELFVDVNLSPSAQDQIREHAVV